MSKRIPFESIREQWKQIRESGDRALFRAHSMKKKDDPKAADIWPIDGLLGGDIYRLAFQDLMKDEVSGRFTFESWVEQRKLAGKTTHILDLFGSAAFISDLTHVDSLTGVRLRNTDQDLLAEYAREGNRDDKKSRYQKWLEIIRSGKRNILSGNLFNTETWEHLSQNLQQRNIPKLDLITIRPVAGLMRQPGHVIETQEVLAVYGQFLKKAYSLLSEDDGILLISLNADEPETNIRVFNTLQKVTNLELEYDYSADSIKIKKTKNSPQRLVFNLDSFSSQS